MALAVVRCCWCTLNYKNNAGEKEIQASTTQRATCLLPPFITTLVTSFMSESRCFCRTDSTELDLALGFREGRSKRGGAVIRAQHLDQRRTGWRRLSNTVRPSPKTNFPQRHWTAVVSSSVKGHHGFPYALSFSLNSSFWQSFYSTVFLSVFNLLCCLFKLTPCLHLFTYLLCFISL